MRAAYYGIIEDFELLKEWIRRCEDSPSLIITRHYLYNAGLHIEKMLEQLDEAEDELSK